jgi:hypothetical protein
MVQHSTGDILRNLLVTSEPEFPCVFNLDSQDVFVGVNCESIQSIGKVCKFLTKLNKVSTVKVMKISSRYSPPRKQQRNHLHLISPQEAP